MDTLSVSETKKNFHDKKCRQNYKRNLINVKNVRECASQAYSLKKMLIEIIFVSFINKTKQSSNLSQCCSIGILFAMQHIKSKMNRWISIHRNVLILY